MSLEQHHVLMNLEEQKKHEEEQRKYEEEQRKHEEEQRKYGKAQRKEEAEQRRLEDEREERRRQHELALKDSEQALKASKLALIEKELELERAQKESAEAIAAQQASSPIPAAPNVTLSSLNSLVPKWTEEELEARLEEVEALFDNFNTTEAKRALVLTKHLDRKAKAALLLLEKSQRGNLAEVRRVITKAYEITPEKWRQRF
ncbi:capping protein inhibiting regulator of actin dynamics-like [Macrobrachium rosenbergii]|uniref:capping protein inhibiting regulator of actin dynamics-like n=1 Tax=Macrobrachium rosenbergii TaxID=79674 RepID=UPI0034D6909E